MAIKRDAGETEVLFIKLLSVWNSNQILTWRRATRSAKCYIPIASLLFFLSFVNDHQTRALSASVVLLIKLRSK